MVWYAYIASGVYTLLRSSLLGQKRGNGRDFFYQKYHSILQQVRILKRSEEADIFIRWFRKLRTKPTSAIWRNHFEHLNLLQISVFILWHRPKLSWSFSVGIGSHFCKLAPATESTSSSDSSPQFLLPSSLVSEQIEWTEFLSPFLNEEALFCHVSYC